MLRIRGIEVRQQGEWFRLYDVFRASERPDYKSPSRWLLSRSFHHLNKPKKVKIDPGYDTIWVRLELLPVYADWISIHFRREVNEAIHDYKLAKATVSQTGGDAGQAEAHQDPGHVLGRAVHPGEDDAWYQESYFAKRRFQQDPTPVL